MIRIKPKLALSYNSTANASLTTAPEKIACKNNNNNRSSLNEVYNAIKTNNSKINSIEDLLNLSCASVGDLDLFDEIINYVEATFKLRPATIYYVVKCKNNEILKRLKKFTKNLKPGDYLNEEHDETSLIRAIKNQDFEQVKLLVECFGASLDLRDSKKRTPLHFAALFDNIDILIYLIKHGANLNAQCIFNDTPLIVACLNRKYKQVEVLIRHGANINLKGNYGNVPMHLIVNDCGNNPVTDDAFYILKLFFKSNVNLCLTNDKEQTCFVRACSTTNLELCALLLNELIKRFSKLTQPHSLCFSSKEDKIKKLKVKTNFDFLNTEVINGLLNATCYLRLNIVKYLFKFIHDKSSLCNELKDCFENKILITAIQRKDINEFSCLFKLFMSYDCYPINDTPLFYASMLIKYWNIKLHIPSQYSFEPLEICIQELINLLIHYNKYKYQQLEQIFFQLFPGVDENIILYSLCGSFRKRFGYLYKKPNSLKLIAKNVIRNSMISLSDTNLSRLNLPQVLKDYLIEFY